MPALANLKVCFLVGSLSHGGAERQLYYMLKSLRECGAKPRLLCLTQGDFWESRINALGVPVIWVGQSGMRLLRLLRMIRELRRDPPAIFQSQHFFTNVYGLAVGRLLGLREIGAMRNDGASERRANGGWASWLDMRTRVLAANSRPAIEYARAKGIPAQRLFLLPNVVDTDALMPAVRPAPAVLNIVAVGRLVRQKRFDRFLSVLVQLRRRSARAFKGIIVGDGLLRGSLQRQAQALGLGPDLVEFQGSKADMAPVYHEADICVLTSDFEGTPNVILEAMACGLPCVATRVGGVPDLIHDGETGFMTESDDQERLVAHLLRLVEDPRLRLALGSRARVRVETTYSLRRLAGFLTELYDLAISRDLSRSWDGQATVPHALLPHAR